MPGIVRVDLDEHAGHESTSPAPFHKTKYAEGSATVFIDTKRVVRQGDKTYCGDPATGASGTVFVDGKPVHRKGDATGGHGSWVENSASTGSGAVFADGE